MRSSIADALATARKAAETEIRGLMFTIIMHNAGRIDTITLNNGNIYAYLNGTKLAPEDVKKLDGMGRIIRLYEKYKVPLSLKKLSITVRKTMDGIR